MHCKARQVAFECYFCEKTFALARGGGDATHVARKVSTQPVGESPSDIAARRGVEVQELAHVSRVLELQTEVERRKKEKAMVELKPRDPKQAREEWCEQQLSMVAFEVVTMERSKVAELKMLAEIDANPSYAQKDRDDLKHYIRHRFENVRDRLRVGDIRM